MHKNADQNDRKKYESPGIKEKIVFKVILVGDAGVGKSSLLNCFVSGKVPEEYNVTIGMEFGSKNVTLSDGTRATMQVWDAAGQEYFRSVVRSFYRNVAAVIVVYNICKLESLTGALQWLQEARNNQEKDETIYILVGNQNDKDSEREISEEKGQEVAKESGCAHFYESSARKAFNVDKIFKDVSEALYRLHTKNMENPIQLPEPRSSFRLKSGKQLEQELEKKNQQDSCC